MFHVKQSKIVVMEMASYTMQLRTIIEQPTQYEEGLSLKERIEIGRKKLFDFDYPIFDESYRKVFETHFIRNFYMREIGVEVEELFKFNLETWLSINMPYFNKLFESELIKFDPLLNSEMNVTHTKQNDKIQNDNRDITRTSTENNETNQTMNQKSNSDSSFSTDEDVNTNTDSQRTTDDFERDLTSDNPDSRLAITTNDGQGVIEYASGIDERTRNNKENVTSGSTQKGKTQGTGESNTNLDVTGNETSERINEGTQKDTLVSDINEIEDYIQHRVGKIGVQTYSKMLMEFRETFIRIERMIFDEMQELFMLVY